MVDRKTLDGVEYVDVHDAWLDAVTRYKPIHTLPIVAEMYFSVKFGIAEYAIKVSFAKGTRSELYHKLAAEIPAGNARSLEDYVKNVLLIEAERAENEQ
ncbi:MAG: hypothetical protein HC892_00375 [Saprospiraceae bacterium]|nr:hypothetical protein [Saprospiraceae bacterium]